jgi:hypothetical protein
MISLPIQTLFLSPPDTPRTNEPPIIVSWHLFSYNEADKNIKLYAIFMHDYEYLRLYSILYLSKPNS